MRLVVLFYIRPRNPHEFLSDQDYTWWLCRNCPDVYVVGYNGYFIKCKIETEQCKRGSQTSSCPGLFVNNYLKAVFFELAVI